MTWHWLALLPFLAVAFVLCEAIWNLPDPTDPPDEEPHA